jgi:hypothetical protein
MALRKKEKKENFAETVAESASGKRRSLDH